MLAGVIIGLVVGVVVGAYQSDRIKAMVAWVRGKLHI